MMKHLSLLGFVLFSSTMMHASAHVLVVEGQYQNKNVYVSNSLGETGVGFCAYEVRVNGKVTSDEVNSSAFEINLNSLKLNNGTDVVIEIYHRDGCTPKVLNSSVLKPMPTFKTKEITLSQAGLLKWSTSGESGILTFEIEQYKWQKWVKVGEVEGKGTPGENNYQFQVTLISGNNRFRVVQKGNLGKTEKSPVVEIGCTLEKPTFKVESNSLSFSAPTQYEIHDEYGQVRKRGFGTKVDIANLSGGTYYLSYDNYVDTFKK